MIDYEREFGKPEYAAGARQVQIAATFKIVYGWMCAGLALSGVIAWYTAVSGLWKTVLQGPGFFGCIIAELALVFVLSLAINKLPVAVAYLMFLGYAALNASGLDLVVSFAGILIFTGLTMYDAQKVKQMAAQEGTLDRAAIQKLGIIGALQLYLDFINLFLHILRFLGRKR